jgi:nucleoside-triphosphatase THEP1
MVSLEFNGLGADEIKRRPEVETLPVTRDNRTEVMKKVLNWLTEGVN